ncbi:MAG: tetratricopeptide repeat protein, partial [Candidatus Thorarchaeota archaeon]
MTQNSAELLEEAMRFIDIGQYDVALAQLKQIVEIEKESSVIHVEALVRMGRIYWHRGKYEQAQKILEDAEKLSVEHSYLQLQGSTVRLMGNIAGDQGFPLEAKELYKKALKIFQSANDEYGIARCMNNLGVTFAEIGDYQSAIHHYDQALELHRKNEDNVGEGSVLNNLGEISRFRGNYDEAEKLYRESLRKDVERGDRYGEALCWGNLGAVSFARKDYKEAKIRVLRAIETFDALGTYDLVYAEIRGLLVGILASTKEFELGQEHLDKLWQAESSMESEYATSVFEFYSGVLTQKQGNLHTSRAHYTKCLKLAEKGMVFEYHLLSLIQLVELELQTYRMTQEDEYLDLMRERLDQTLKIASKHKSVGAEVQLLTLSGFFHMENQQFL